MRVLCLDIEGGFGGSSRSLYYLLKHLPLEEAQTTVWSRRSGPIQPLYDEAGIEHRITPGMPKVSSLPRFSRNLIVFSLFVKDWFRSSNFLTNFYDSLDTFDLVHFNHEALFWLARDMKRKKPKPATMHIRTNLWDSYFARKQCSVIRDSVDSLIFITENERDTFGRHCGESIEENILYNVAEAPSINLKPLTFPEPFMQGKRLLIGCLSNYSWLRGLDRIVTLSVALKEIGRNDIGFVIAGNMELPKSLPGDLGKMGRAGMSLADYARQKEVHDAIAFLGHIPEPERLLVSVDALIKPTREFNPWGRDILEALAAGKPVISVGSYNRFVETGKTGILQENWDALAMAKELARLADDQAFLAKLGETAAARVAQLCNGPVQGRCLLNIWQRTQRDFG